VPGGELCPCLLHAIAVKCLTCGSLYLTFERESECRHPSKWARKGHAGELFARREADILQRRLAMITR
jgi:hypothetical protein